MDRCNGIFLVSRPDPGIAWVSGPDPGIAWVSGPDPGIAWFSGPDPGTPLLQLWRLLHGFSLMRRFRLFFGTVYTA